MGFQSLIKAMIKSVHRRKAIVSVASSRRHRVVLRYNLMMATKQFRRMKKCQTTKNGSKFWKEEIRRQKSWALSRSLLIWQWTLVRWEFVAPLSYSLISHFRSAVVLKLVLILVHNSTIRKYFFQIWIPNLMPLFPFGKIITVRYFYFAVILIFKLVVKFWFTYVIRCLQKSQINISCTSKIVQTLFNIN